MANMFNPRPSKEMIKSRQLMSKGFSFNILCKFQLTKKFGTEFANLPLGSGKIKSRMELPGVPGGLPKALHLTTWLNKVIRPSICSLFEYKEAHYYP